MEPTASSLVRGISDFSDHQAWFEFNHKYRPLIRKILCNKGLRSDEVDDAVQETYLAMLSTISRFQYDRRRGKFRSWLAKIAQRTAGSQRRQYAEPTTACDSAASARADQTALPALEDERMRLCLDLARSRFDAKTWLPFYLRFIEETPIEEVQRMTNMNRNAIYQCVHRVKRCLKELLQQLDHEPHPDRHDE